MWKFNWRSIRFKSSSSTRWLNRQKNDEFSKKSKTQHFKSRAAFKLIEINERFHILRNCRNIVDLGYAPGSWSQVIKSSMEKSGKRGKILGVDLINCSPPEGVDFIQGDFLHHETQQKIIDYFNGQYVGEVFGSKKLLAEKVAYPDSEPLDHDIENKTQSVDLILSDMLENTTGLKNIDHLSSMDICNSVMIFSNRLLKKNGSLVMKFYQGNEQTGIENKLKQMFTKVYIFKPKSSRSESKEMFFVALKLK
ncbi:rRNA methyltransferase 2, mitochondrial [[Candida] jaroonii]|uniref:rRNA methyltransferase 2, mitochondrial n=1 Tax=[Candida] jaroonii TaxID=467808 RepID=A0ACA9Y3P1_9ASCO|nr:rRNA methyltransferase 2, mitochondrial [[Candida] jaroonii]